MLTRLLKGVLCILLCTITGIAYAQKHNEYSVKGILVDSLSNDGEPYATIKITTESNPQKPVKLNVTDEKGRFKETLSMPGKYYITFSSIGKNTVTKSFSLSEERKSIDLGKIFTSEATEMLKGVEVVAQKPLVKAEIDKITYSIEDDPDSKINTTLEMLKKVPLVTVDGEDNIKVNGSSNFKVHVNGKPNTLMSNNPKEVLRSLPASSIKSIEVITEPGAKYDAEGIGGILNIVTTDTKMQGYNVTLGAGAGNTSVSGYGYATAQVGKFTVSGNYSYNHSSSPTNYFGSGREDFTSDINKHLSSNGSSKDKGNYQFGNIEGSYEIDTLNLITFSANMFGGIFKTNSHSENRMLNSMEEMTYRYNTVNTSKNNFGNVGINFDYQHSFKKKGEYLTLSYKFNNSPNGNESSTEYKDIVDVPFELNNQYFDNDAHTSEHTGQIDYVNPINSKHYIDAGAKFIGRQSVSDSKYFNLMGDGNMQQDNDMSSKFNQGQNILAAYADYQLKLKKFGFKTGVRYEHTFMDVEYALKPERNFSADFDDFVPTVNLSYMISNTSSIRANYNMRINRPGIWYLNPFRDTSNPTSVRYGNPNLETEKVHIIGTTFSSFSAKFNVNATLNYSLTNNGIEGYSFMKDGVLNSTYCNAGKKQTTRLSLWMNWNPGNKTRISINASGSYSDFKSDVLDTRNSGFDGNLFGNIQQTLPWDMQFGIYGGGGSPYISLQGKGSSFYYYGLNLSKSFLKEKRLNVSIYANNLFNKYNTYRNETVTDTFRSWSKNQYYSLGYGFRISWRFGELKTQVKKTARSINNDDMKSGGGSNSNGGGQQQ